MFQAKAAFSGFSVNDLAKAKAFYGEMLGLQKTSGKAPVIYPGDEPPLLCPEGNGGGAPS